MSDRYTTMPSFNFEDSTDDDSGISSTSGPNSIKLDSEAQSVTSWDSESQRSWENDEEDEDEDDALGELDAWMNDEVYVPKRKSSKQENRKSKFISPDAYMESMESAIEAKTFDGVIEPLSPMYQTSGQISERLASEFNKIIKVESARERARKASREIIKERNDTSGGGKRSLKREHIIIKWMLRVTHLNKNLQIDFADWILDGTVLTLVMTTLDFNSVERDKYKQAGRDPAKERIENVQKAILNYGVDPKYLFKLEDVLEKKNTPKVVRCLEEVAKISRQETHIVMDTLRRDLLYT